MRRSSFPNFPHSFYAPSAEEAAFYRRPRRPFSASVPESVPAPAPTTRSVINIPVFDSLPPQKHPITPSPSSPPAPLIDPSSAATTIQSYFRGFCIRRCRPLLHLRSIAKARKQLEVLQSELESPGFPLKVRASEKERLQFCESVMVIILRLDAIEGSLAEVRSQRKAATKMAIKLQDAIDAIMMQKDDLQPTDCPSPDAGMASALCEQSEEPLCLDANVVQGETHAVSEGIVDVNAMQEESTSPEDDVADKCVSNLNNDDVMDMVENVSPLLLPPKAEDVVQQIECVELLMSKSDVTGENAVAGSGATHVAEAEVSSAIDTLHFVAHNNHLPNNALVAKVDQDISVDDMKVVSHGSAKGASSDRSYTCMDAVEDLKEGLGQDIELCPGTPTAEEKYGDAAHQNQCQGPSTDLEKLTEGNCSSDGFENRCDEEAYENCCDEAKAQSSTVGTPSPPDNALLHQLSEDCRQLKSLVGKLLVHNKAQSKILCALGERLELLEHQQRRNQKQMREKRKLMKKGSKRSGKCRNCE